MKHRSLLLLYIYMSADTLLTVVCLKFGLFETNQCAIVCMAHVGPVLGLILHRTVACFSIAILVTVMFVLESRIGFSGITRRSILLLVMFYIYVLTRNIVYLGGVIWNYN